MNLSFSLLLIHNVQPLTFSSSVIWDTIAAALEYAEAQSPVPVPGAFTEVN